MHGVSSGYVCRHDWRVKECWSNQKKRERERERERERRKEEESRTIIKGSEKKSDFILGGI
jgi:hypothetical protein